ncbi:hypothetical protein ACFFWD_15980 [Bradyrhizobium erythrophlei]|uniref:hypothetical protein n=1 Tax=Bradyrhizobium erythrophlei TaxID=1437360 RepID=UPI0035E550E1
MKTKFKCGGKPPEAVWRVKGLSQLVAFAREEVHVFKPDTDVKRLAISNMRRAWNNGPASTRSSSLDDEAEFSSRFALLRIGRNKSRCRGVCRAEQESRVE